MIDLMFKPFSNGTEFMIWHENNCAKCCNYDWPNKRNAANCKFAFDVDFSAISGEMPMKSAEWIGLDKSQPKCNFLNIKISELKLIHAKQLYLF